MRSRRPNESFLDYKKRVLDTKSASFCGAKWYNATIWLGSGMTTSCHHPPAHKINLAELAERPQAIHNTEEKKKQRLEMQLGLRPSGCEYCWRIEDAKSDAVSDRPYKSVLYSEEELQDAFMLPHTEDVNLRTLEIAFDRTCDFACSYCNPAFSSSWVKDVKKNGPYLDLVSDGRGHFIHTHDSAQLYRLSETNPYVEAFFQWWEQSLHKDLRELRITGGEPLMSGHTWKLLDWFKDNHSDCHLAINSNLGMEDHKLDEFIDKVREVPHLELYTSCEALSSQAEYIRDGLDYQQWLRNMERLCESKVLKGLHVMATINGLCLSSLPEFLESMCDLKRKYGRDYPTFTLNILRFPSFQSPLVLPLEKRKHAIDRLQAFLDRYADSGLLHDMERDHVRRLMSYLVDVESPHEGASPTEVLRKDFKRFYQQYDQRRSKDFVNTFPDLAEWYETL